MKNDRAAHYNAPKSRGRRIAMKKLAVGMGALAGFSGLPEKWTRPIVEGIVLPSHAQTSASLLLCPELTLTLLSGTQSSEILQVRVQGCVRPPVSGVEILLAVQASSEGTAFREQKNTLEQALGVVFDLLFKEAVAADCPEIAGSAATDASGHFSVDFEVLCGPGIRSVHTYAALAVDHTNGGSGYGVVSVPGEAKQETAKEPADSPQLNSFCFMGIFNQLEDEDLTMIHEGTEYTVPPGYKDHELTVFEESFSLRFQASTDSEKVLKKNVEGVYKTVGKFTAEITISDAACNDRYSIGNS